MGCSEALFGMIQTGDCGPSTTNNSEYAQLTQNTTTSVKKNQSTSDVNSTNIQGLSLYLGEDSECIGGIVTNQKINSSVTVLQQITDQESREIKNDIESSLSMGIDAAMESQVGFLANESNQKLVNDMKADISAIVANNVSVDKINAMITKSYNAQNQTLEVLGKVVGTIDAAGNVTGPCVDINQDMHASIVASQIVDNIYNEITTNKSVIDAAQQITSDMKSTATGPIEEIGNLISSFSDIFIIMGVVIVIAIIAFVMLKPKKINANGAEFA
jgi:hypothetical protein